MDQNDVVGMIPTVIVGEGLRALPRMDETGINDSGQAQRPVPTMTGNRNLHIVVDSCIRGKDDG